MVCVSFFSDVTVFSQPNLDLNHHADQSLKSFCEWQRGLYEDHSETNIDLGLSQHDNAVLVTG